MSNSAASHPSPGDDQSTARRVVHVKWPEAKGAVYVGRPGKFGNPYPLSDAANATARGAVVEQYRQWFMERVETDTEFRSAVLQLRAKTLSCWCPTRRDPWRACHADVILEWLDANPEC